MQTHLCQLLCKFNVKAKHQTFFVCESDGGNSHWNQPRHHSFQMKLRRIVFHVLGIFSANFVQAIQIQPHEYSTDLKGWCSCQLNKSHYTKKNHSAQLISTGAPIKFIFNEPVVFAGARTCTAHKKTHVLPLSYYSEVILCVCQIYSCSMVHYT